MSVVSPWAHSGVSATTFGVASIVWLTFTQVVASGLGGYLAGRLRTRWTEVHTDEVYFRDTAHGFLAWAISSLTTAALLTSVIGSIIGGGVQVGAQAGAAVTGGVATSATAAVAAGSDAAKPDSGQGPVSYFVDSLFRDDANAPSSRAGSGAGAAAQQALGASAVGGAGTDASNASAATAAAEVARIFANAPRTETLPAEDLRHVGHLVAQRTGLSQQEAEQRVSDTYARLQAKLRDAEAAVREAADQARRASAYTALWLFISLLMGAFAASWSATYGGRRRDV
jgi:hypothetical protein